MEYKKRFMCIFVTSEGFAVLEMLPNFFQRCSTVKPSSCKVGHAWAGGVGQKPQIFYISNHSNMLCDKLNEA